MKLLEELKWRGLVSHTTDESQLANILESPSINFYCGFDPTAPSLHHGNLVQIILMRHLQLKGHKPYLVIGGATGLIGDPKQSGERIMRAKDKITIWVDNLTQQIKRFFDFKGQNGAVIINNLDWTKDITVIDFLRDIGKFFRVGNMISKETVAKRLNSLDGISYTEFSYQVLQAWDYLYLYQKYNIVLQTGGQDQWGNLTAGLDLIRKHQGKQVSVLTTPIITKADGSKFGKSEGGQVLWLNPSMLSPYLFYQFWLNTSDNDVEKLIKIFTFLSPDEIIEILKQHKLHPEQRLAQKTLAKTVTTFVHGSKGLEQALTTSNFFFGKIKDINNLEHKNIEKTLDKTSFYQVLYSLKNLEPTIVKIGDNIVDVFVKTALSQSKSDARRSIKNGGLYLNHIKISDENYILTKNDFYYNKYAILRKGKKNTVGIQIDK
ncbi:MAG: tyrosine--tRNA ligase [Bifidobacteriaceae bacterium]|jgi:tyrosyl-tRNA synthetase|nr:tyrosine--tRNA ligase [Bifidobacteriaceae bacterium]